MCIYGTKRHIAGSIFLFPDGIPLTKVRFMEIVRAALEELKLQW